ncbi:hypothetical protein [Streptomyces sp. NPDC054874]
MTQTTVYATVEPPCLPAPSATSDADVHLRIHGHTKIHSIELVFRTPNPDDLADQNITLTSPGWHTTHRSADSITAEPTTAAAVAGPIEVALTGLATPTPGPVYVDATLLAPDGTRHSSRHILQQLPDGEVPLSNFHVEPLNPAKGKKVTLVWTGPQKEAGYTLMRSDVPTPISLSNITFKANNVCTYVPDVPATEAITAFALSFGDVRRLAWAATQLGDIHAGTLSVKGKTQLLHTPVAVVPPTQGEVKEITKIPSTDGFVVASLRSGTGHARLAAGGVVRELQSTRDASAHVQLPAAAGASVSYEAEGAATSSVVWFPLGGGTLTNIEGHEDRQ